MTSVRTALRPLALLALVAMLASGCTQTGNDQPRQNLGTVAPLEGRATLTSGGSTSTIQSELKLTQGDVVAIQGSGAAMVKLPSGTEMELRHGSLDVLNASAVRLRGASMLAVSQAPLEVSTEGASARFERGTVRFDLSGRIGAYDTSGLVITIGSETKDLPRYWQVLVGGGAFQEARPLQIDAADVWDQRLLSSALETDASLANLATGFDAQFGTTTPPALLEHLAAIGVAADALAPFASRPRSDIALGLAFARESKEADKAGRYLQALTLNALGASWGLLTVEFGVSPDGLLDGFEEEINVIPIPQPSPTVPVPRSSPASRPTGTPAPVTPTSPAQPSGAASPSPSPSPGGNPSILPLLPPDLRRIIDELYGLVEDILPIV